MTTTPIPDPEPVIPVDGSWTSEVLLAHGRVTGRWALAHNDSGDSDLSPDVVGATGTVLMTPTVPAGKSADATVFIAPITGRIVGGVLIDEDLRAVDGFEVVSTDAEIGVEEWAWLVEVHLDGVRRALQPEPFWVKVPAGETVSLSGVSTPATSEPYEVIEGRRGPQGPRGAGVTGISAEGDRLTVAWDDSKSTVITVPTARGIPGTAIEIGPTTTVSPYDEEASVTVTGDDTRRVLRFRVPQGFPGDRGPSTTISIGTVTTGATAAATMTGYSPSQTLNLVLPLGYDSGWRNVTSLILTSTYLDASASGTVAYLRRIGSDVVMVVRLSTSSASLTSVREVPIFDVLPRGFRPPLSITIAILTDKLVEHLGPVVRSLDPRTTGGFVRTGPPASGLTWDRGDAAWASSTAYTATLRWTSGDPTPTSLPGIAVSPQTT